MTVQQDQAETVAFLTRLAGAPPLETHISYLFLGPDTVWKLKKSVRLPFLDFSVLAGRRHFCEREYALNAPSAPGLYRDVVPVVRREGTVALGGEGEVLDWVVRMARVPAGDFMDAKAAGGLPPRLLDAIADAVGAYHAACPPRRDILPDMARIALGNVPSARSAGLPEAEIFAWRDGTIAALATLMPWRTARAAAGFVRRVHGDLHLGNLCLWHGKPTLFDALEFDEALGAIDTAYDLAFLLMDLDRRVDRHAANRVLNRYIARTGDADLVRGLPAFLAMRAMVRAHVEARSGHPEPARKYLGAALDYLVPHPPIVVAVGGLPGTGKSTLARALAPALGRAPGALILRSDEIRKRQHGAAPEDPLPASAYTSRKSAAVFAELMQTVEMASRSGQAVIADATFLSLVHRDQVRDAAMRAGARFRGLWLTAPTALLEQRVAARSGDASDATVAVLRAAMRNDPGAGSWQAIDASDAHLAEQAARSHLVF